MYLYRLGSLSDIDTILRTIGVQAEGIAILSKKIGQHTYYIKDLRTPAANILKQDALSIGADLAVPSGVIVCESEYVDCVLTGTQKQIEILSKKELMQPFGLKAVAKMLSSSMTKKLSTVRIMGVLNVNEDSFYTGSRYMAEEAVAHIRQMISEGASLIDVGAVSSRPGSVAVAPEVELARIQFVCDTIYSEKLYMQADFSIDSHTPAVIAYALRHGFVFVNDITGARDASVVKLAVAHNAKLCIMHMQGNPQTMQESPCYEDVVVEVSQFFDERIAFCESLGMCRDDLVLDVGIGFGKKLAHNTQLIKHLSHFSKFGCELLVGASRKSMIDHIVPTVIEDRLPGTLAIHMKAIENGATIIRCHDVAPHKQMLEILKHIN